MKTNYDRRKFFKVSGAAVAGSAAALSGINFGFIPANASELATAGYTPYHRSDLQGVPVINVHTHLTRSGPENATTEQLNAEVKNHLKLLDKMNIRKVVILCIRKTDERVAYHYSKTAPDRFIVFIGMDFSDLDKPGWSDSMVQRVEEHVRQGARGIKLWLGARGQENAMPMDDPRLDPVYKKAAELGLPIAIHCNDPEEFYYPPNKFNFWTGADYIKEKGFSDRLDQVVSREDIVRQIRNMLSKNPNTTFILVHMAFLSRQLALLADILDRHPNVHLDLSAAVEELGRSPKESAAFMTYYADRILFGTDGNNTTAWNAFRHRHFIALETNLDNIQGPYRRSWNIHGMNLSKEVLEKIYYKNAEAMLARQVNNSKVKRSY
jgi:uncharacterized protein